MSKKRFDPVYLLIPLYALILLGAYPVMTVLHTETPEPVTLTVEEIPEPPVPDLSLDVNTMCEQANQFGYNYISTLYFEDEAALVVTESSTQVDNKTNRGHVVAFYSNHYVDSWFDTKNDATYTTFGNGDDIESDWFCTVAGVEGDPLSLHLKDTIDYRNAITDLQLFVDICKEVTPESKKQTEQGIWYSIELPSTIVDSSTGLLPSKTTARIFVPKDNSLVTQVDVILDFDKNNLGITREIFEHEIETDVEYYCDVPAVVTEELVDYNTQLALYTTVMR